MPRLLALVCAVVFFESAFYAVITPLLPALSAQFDLSKAQAGVLTAAYGAGTLAGSIPLGWLVARGGVRITLQLGLGLMVLASVAFPLAENAVLLDAARFVQGIGAAGCWTAGLGWLVRTVPGDRRGAAIGSAMAAATIGALFGPVLGGVASAAGTQLVFSAAAGFGVACMLAAVRMPAPERPGHASLRALTRAVRQPEIALGLWLMLVPGVLFGTIYVLAPLHLDRLGAGAAAIAVAFLVASGLEALVSPLAGRLTDTRGPRVPAYAGLAGGALAMTLLPWPGAVWLLVGVVMVTAPLIGFLWTPSITLVSNGAERLDVEPGFAFGLTNLAWALGQAVGSAGSAALAQATADAVPELLLAAVCAVTLVALRRPARAVA
jgi:predicted MFS family arabinose efflux permease